MTDKSDLVTEFQKLIKTRLTDMKMKCKYEHLMNGRFNLFCMDKDWVIDLDDLDTFCLNGGNVDFEFCAVIDNIRTGSKDEATEIITAHNNINLDYENERIHVTMGDRCPPRE